MRRRAATLAIVVTLAVSTTTYAHMGPGPVDIGKGAACYNPATGEIVVSMNRVQVWFIESFSESLTGATPIFSGMAEFETDNDGSIGQADLSASVFTFTDHNLGPVAVTGLPLSDLIIAWYPTISSHLLSAPVTLCVPEPTAVTLSLIAATIFWRRRKGRLVEKAGWSTV